MIGKRMPSPETLSKQRVRKPSPKPKRSPLTFRLTEADEDALHALAERAQLGPSAFARRIVEHYIRQHAPQRVKKGS
jgi:hypothetical protein